MNGYALSDYENFDKTWKLVTVRHRQDTGEQRFIYANDLAYDALKAGGKDYPDGAVFAKIGAKTGMDPLFPSSAEPAEVSRYQLMVRNSKKHADTGGWGYAVFDSEGRLFPEPVAQQTTACYACHQVARERSDVFARIAHFDIKKTAPNEASGSKFNAAFEFALVGIETLPAPLSKKIPKPFKNVYRLQGSITKFFFQGTLDEVRPALAHQVWITKQPAALVTDTGDRFSLVFSTERKCQIHGKEGVELHAAYTVQSGMNELDFCYAE